MRKMKRSTFYNRCTEKDIFKDDLGLPLAVYPEYVSWGDQTRLCIDSRYNFFVDITDLAEQCDNQNIKYDIQERYSPQLDDNYNLLIFSEDNFIQDK